MSKVEQTEGSRWVFKSFLPHTASTNSFPEGRPGEFVLGRGEGKDWVRGPPSPWQTQAHGSEASLSFGILTLRGVFKEGKKLSQME